MTDPSLRLFSSSALIGNNDNWSADPAAAQLAAIAAGEETLIAGFSLEGPSARPVLLRVIGPTLAQFGVTGTLTDPHLTLFRGESVIAANDNWEKNSGATAATFLPVGAFALPPGSKDAALFLNLSPGTYTVHATSVTGTPGIALIEVYDAAP